METSAAWDQSTLTRLLEQYKDVPGGLLPLLHAIQEAFGYVPEDSVPFIAEALKQTRAEIHGVISFYHHFRSVPPGRHLLQVCRAEACQASGSRALEDYIKKTLGIDYHHTTHDREFTLEPVYCLGNCACGPSISVNDQVVGRVDAGRFNTLLEELSTQVVEVQV